MEDYFEYFLQVLKNDQLPQWPISDEQLEVGSRDLGSGYIQFWAYPRSLGKDSQEIPPAEKLASQNPSDTPAILIDEPIRHKTLPHHMSRRFPQNHFLELILIKDGHAWAKIESSLENLEENLSALLGFAKESFNLTIEHFMTTARVSETVEDRLNRLENGESEELIPKSSKSIIENPNLKMTETPLGFRQVEAPTPQGERSGVGDYRLDNHSKSPLTAILIVIFILVILGICGFFFRNKIIAKLQLLRKTPPVSTTITPIPTKTPTPTPTISVSRGNFKVAVLNGTTKSGAASDLANSLKSNGWNVTKTGNAPTQNQSQTLVHYKKGDDVAAQVMISDLASSYQATSSADLDTSSLVDLQVVIGNK